MTADAKVGLLLGLFFIVLIAYLINGFPSFLQSAAADDVVKTTAVVAPSGPDLVIDHRVTETAQRLTGGIPLRATEPPQDVIVLDSGAQTPPVSAAVIEMPAVPLPASAAIAEQVRQLSPRVEPQQSRTATAARSHTVQQGETLASIAQKHYGPEEGNRRAVVQKLYEANAHVLSSPDRVLAGMTLTIPPLSDEATSQPSVAENLLQRFSGVFERAASQPQTARSAEPRTVEYVVQQGDSLWKIAEKTLGDGRRFETLVEMNKDRLKSPDEVVAGMKLRVPVP